MRSQEEEGGPRKRGRGRTQEEKGGPRGRGRTQKGGHTHRRKTEEENREGGRACILLKPASHGCILGGSMGNEFRNGMATQPLSGNI